MGINEAAGYGAVSLAAIAAGYLAATYGLRPQPFLLGVVFALAGLLLSIFFVRETHGHARHEAALLARPSGQAAESAQQTTDQATQQHTAPSFKEIFLLTSWKDRRLFAVSQAGLVNNLNDGLAWGLLPLFFAAGGLSIAQIGLLAGIYPGVWGTAQLLTGGLSDHLGRKGMIVVGMVLTRESGEGKLEKVDLHRKGKDHASQVFFRKELLSCHHCSLCLLSMELK
jgi:Na+/melibiose symporter-like transporter